MAKIEILVVEDSPTMRQLIVFALKRLKDVNVTEASDGVDGLKKLSNKQFDLMIADINMPIMDGLKLVSLVRQDPKYNNMPIIIVTTEGADEDRKRGLALGANAYLTKPVQTTQLLATVKELLKIP
ncbi:MAG: response regulator [Proteobacteria bacterium]|nr:response regulator [Pseudomonadota bacterium]